MPRLRRTGAKIRSPFGGFAYVVRATPAMVARIAALPFVRWIGHLPHRVRIAPGLTGPTRVRTTLPRRKPRPGVYTVEVFDPREVGRIARAASDLGFEVLSKDAEGRRADRPDRRDREDLPHATRTAFGSTRRPLYPPARRRAHGQQHRDRADGKQLRDRQADGPQVDRLGEIVAVCDTGLDTGHADTVHPDFAGRVVAMKSYPITPDWKTIIFNPGADDGPSTSTPATGHTSPDPFSAMARRRSTVPR